MFDPEAFGAAMGDLIRAAVEPLEKRIEELQDKLNAAPSLESAVVDEIEKRAALMPVPKNGKDADPELIAQLVQDAVKGLPKPEDGTSITLDDVKPFLAEQVAAAVAALPAPKAGKDADMDAVRQMVADAVSALPKPEAAKGLTVDDVRPMMDAAILQIRKDADAAIAEPLSLAEKARDMLLEKVGELKQPEDGKSVTVDDVAPMLRKEVEKAVAALPAPKDGLGLAGAMIDRDGALQITMTNGEVKALGKVVGEDGHDGLSLDAFELEYLPESHEIQLKATAAGRTKELRYPAGGIRPAGYWREGTKAEAGEAWVHDGSLWIARKSTPTKPATGSEDWIIAARKGRDGERGAKGIDGTPPAPIKLSKD
jgi:hypothetical protein